MPGEPLRREPTDADAWSARADAAEAAVVSRHLRRLWGLPWTTLGVVGWPATRGERFFLRWHYWWQAHLIDCAVDAAERQPSEGRRTRIVRLTRSHRLRNLTGWTNAYYDDMAWLGLALERAQLSQLVSHKRAIAKLDDQMYSAWAPEIGGGIPWRKGSDFYNAPANGPAAILLLRTGKVWRAEEMAEWIDATLRDPDTGLIFDGIRLRPTGSEVEKPVYTYCQGVVLGLETELAVQTGEGKHRERVARLVDAVDKHLTPNGVIRGSNGGDGGLFPAILARYLTLVALLLPGDTVRDERARQTAARIVLDSAESAWANRLAVDNLPMFGHDWTKPAEIPAAGEAVVRNGGSVDSSTIPERDLSVQVSGWMLMEAAARLARSI
ncbi:glycoside hydrolase family 76 protein [Antrihabitans sp. YC2-6]|uniref:glycoside hydrolase family 76 protein n=1 Tax=Antrihabitans sp. YC2-6 TaxID=2799498 RepID=UPI0018F57CCD|nr:glycoside hydrolase family 76 protein [Antrihabitans sp. YC2-6]MBJ8348981.1 fructose-bisphosphate aldolase [Antrihabitans sp. YC2-6]